MKYFLAAVTCLAGATQALAAPQWVEDFCFAQLEQVRPPLSSGRGDREAFMARCIADLTPTPQAQRRGYKKPR